jgi:aminoglycoside phosphotransferase (APT) family kinase protein
MNFIEAFLRQRPELRRLQSERYRTLLVTPRFRASRHVVFLIFAPGASDPHLVAKVPRVGQGISLAREAHNLAALQQLTPGGFDSVPQIVCFAPFHGVPVLLETAVCGPLMDPRQVRRHLDRNCLLVTEWLHEVHDEREPASPVEWWETVAAQPLERLRRSFTLNTEEAALLDRTSALAHRLSTARLPWVFEHGDLSHPNIVITGRHSIGVIDWELASPRGLVMSDLFVFLAYAACSYTGATTTDAQRRAVREAFAADGWAMEVACRFARRTGIDPKWIPSLLTLCWARYSAALLARLIEDAPEGTPAPAQTAAWLRTNRYYLLWQDSLRQPLNDTVETATSNLAVARS